MSRPKCLRCGAGPEWIQGKAPNEPVAALEDHSGHRRDTCQWVEDGNGPHATQCGHAFEFTYDGVEANGFKYCCFCGGAIILKLPNEKDRS